MLHSREAVTGMIVTDLKLTGQFNCHVKIFPIYNQRKKIVASLTLWVEIQNIHKMDFPHTREKIF